MEPLSTAAIAAATIILTKMLEKPGEKLGEVLTQQIGNFINLIRRKPLPKTQAIEQQNPNATFDQAVQELETAAAFDPELSNALEEVVHLVQQNSALSQQITQVALEVKNNPSLIVNQSKLAEKIGIVQQGSGTVNIETFNF